MRPDLSDTNWVGANLRGANLSGANLSGANLVGAQLFGVDLSAAQLVGAQLSIANLNMADLSRANLRDVNFHGAILLNTLFVNVDLSETEGLKDCSRLGPSIVDIQTLERSGPLPPTFLYTLCDEATTPPGAQS